eukprot:scaffold148402_cov39-Prasinocladus_malaysianus.AAC.1
MHQKQKVTHPGGNSDADSAEGNSLAADETHALALDEATIITKHTVDKADTFATKGRNEKQLALHNFVPKVNPVDINKGQAAGPAVSDAQQLATKAAPVIKVECFWWQQEGQQEFPFPLEFLECDEGEACTRAEGKCACLKGGYSYRMMTDDERQATGKEAADRMADLHSRYPKLLPQQQHLHRETLAFRSAQTANRMIRLRCWNDLLLYEATDLIPKKWRSKFRCDPYGNVVSLEAGGMSLCAFEVDHIFPWARGGLSVPANFMALYWGANRHVKSDAIPNALSTSSIDRMQCGLSVDNFLELLRNGEEKEKRSRRQKYFKQMEIMLTVIIGIPSDAQSVFQPGLVRTTLISHYKAVLTDLDGVQHAM